MIIDYCEQGSDEWIEKRLGLVTASCFSKIISGTGKASKSALPYMKKLLTEYLTGESQGTFQSDWMARGIEIEPEALAFYAFINNVEIQRVGLIYKDENKLVACSPDALIKGMKKGVEIKCPKIETHEKYLKDNKLPTKYIPQVQGNMYVTGFKTWDFMSYYPGATPLIVTVERDEDYISEMHSLIHPFTMNLLESKRQLMLAA